MSQRDYQGKGVLTPQVRDIRVRGSFILLTGAGTINAAKVKGEGFGYAPVNGAMALKGVPGNNPTPLTTPGIAYVSAGLHIITFEDSYQDLECLVCTLAGPATGTNLFVQTVDPPTNLATASKGVAVQILTTNNAGSPTDAPANTRLHFVASFRDTTSHYQKP